MGSGLGSITVNGTNGITVTGSPVSSGGTLNISADPSQTPYFKAFLSNNTSSTGVVVCDALQDFSGSFNYNTTTSIATVPLRGAYLFIGNVGIINPPTNFSFTLGIVNTGLQYQTQLCNGTAMQNSGANLCLNASWIVYLQAGDTVQLYFNSGGNTFTLLGRQGITQFTSFSGILLSPLIA